MTPITSPRVPQHRLLAVLLAVLALAAARPAQAQKLIRVPQDRSLASALTAVSAGGVIEIAGGTYAAPPNGFLIRNPNRTFTVRAAAGATVVLDGGGHAIFRLESNNRSRAGRVIFRRLTFRNGGTTGGGRGGALTLARAVGEVVDCTFEDNRATGSGDGGAIKVRDGSALTVVGGSFQRNTSLTRGGAIVVQDQSTLVARRVWFKDNRINLPGHHANSAGGAVYVVSASAELFDCLFEGNQAGFVGGAVYVFGHYGQPQARVDVTRSLLRDNRSIPAPGAAIGGRPSGGALHAENNAALRLHQTRVLDNFAELGAGVSSYRALVEVHGSVLRGNRALPGTVGDGGAIFAESNDLAGDAVFNPPSAEVRISASLLQGAYPSPQEAPVRGGCIHVLGDTNRLFGERVPALGGVVENRARLTVEGSILADCDAGTSGRAGSGGAVLATLTDVTLHGSLVIDSDVRGSESTGGGVNVGEQSVLRAVATTFAGNSAERAGGAIFASGSTLQVEGSRFFANAISPGVGETVSQSRGAAIATTPSVNSSHPTNVDGTVRGSVFAQNDGIPLHENDPQSGPFDDVRYEGNQIHSDAFGGLVFVNTLAAPGGLDAPGLDALTVFRAGRPATDKSATGNQRLFSPPALGTLIPAPLPPAVGAGPGAPAGESLVGYGWSGFSASVGGVPLPDHAGLLPVAGPGELQLRVDGAAAASTLTGIARCSGGPFLCLNGERFRASVEWRSGDTRGTGRAVQLTGDTGYFWFFEPANVELATKVLDGTGINGFWWVFYGGLTDRELSLTVVDLQTGASKTYLNAQGKLASVGDTTALEAGGGASAVRPATAVDTATAAPLAAEVSATTAAATACQPSSTRLCLAGGRIAAELTWKAPGAGGQAVAVPLTADTGVFWFNSASNLEVVVKVLDGRPINGHFWLFKGALTNLEHRLTITDTATGASETYVNPPGKFTSLADVEALP